MIIELQHHSRALYVRAFGRDTWAQWLAEGERPDFSHPQGRRWGLHRERDHTALYLGRVYINTGRTHQPTANAV